MKKASLFSSLALASVAVGMAGTAHAATINGGDALVLSGTLSDVNATQPLQNATEITIGTNNPRGKAGTGDLSSITSGSTVAFNNLMLDLGPTSVTSPVMVQLSSSNGNRFTFTSTSSTINRTGSNILAIDIEGTIVDNTNALSATPATLLFSFNQSGGPGNTISGSASITSPSISVPEPLTNSGAALALGLGFLVRKKTRLAK
jgi:hypothetical protein